MKNELILNDLRICFFGKDIVRIERARDGYFCDENTFFIPDRNRSGQGGREYVLRGESLYFDEYALRIPQGGGLNGLYLEKNGKTIYRYKRKKNSGELPRPYRTPEVFAISDTPRIFIPQGGYSAEREGEYRIEEGAEDIYLLFAEGDAKKLRRLYVALTGRCELVRLSTFGGWNSKYYAYREEEAKQLILDYERYKVPLDNMVIDTDWRASENGWGYEINSALFPDMKGFLDFAHSRGVEIMFNDHPEPVGQSHVFAPCEIEYREKNLQSLMRLGLDTWWYDRNWHTHLISPTKNVRWETFGLYLFCDITKNFYRKKSGNADIYRRPVIMGNVVDVSNGDYCGIKDSASHRYSVQWTGDIASLSCTLAQEVENLVRCTDNCVPYMHSDCGGHTGNPDKEQFVRWMQYGTLSPVFRPHCTNSVERFREPWLYDGETLSIVREYNLLRYRLIPYLYSRAYETYQTGVGMFRSLAMEFPQDRRARRTDEYLLGGDLLISPVCGAIPRKLRRTDYSAPVEVTFFDGTEGKGEPIAAAVWDRLDMNLNHVSPANGVPVYNFSAKIRTKICVRKPVQLYIKTDDGATVFLDGKCVLEDKSMHSAMLFPLAMLAPNEDHSLEIDYFQAGGEAFLGLYAAEISNEGEKEVYLPAGRWMDLFSGTVYSGGRTVRKKYDLKEMPLFVRLGSLIPLAEAAQNTKRQDWRKIVYDFYPDKSASADGYLYEDDGETTAYQTGQFRRSEYFAEYHADENAYVVTLKGAQGGFSGERFCQSRTAVIKFHCVSEESDVIRICVDDRVCAFSRCEKAQIFPLNAGEGAPDGTVLSVSFEADVSADHVIKFYLADGSSAVESSRL